MRLVDLGLRFGLVPLALAAGSCSDPVTPTPRGGWTVMWQDPGVDCNVAQHNTKVGDISAATKNTVVIDGEGGATVKCSVKGSGNFAIDAEARASGPLRDLRISIPSLAPGQTQDNPAKGSVSYASTNTAGNSYVSPNDQPCSFYFVNNSQNVAAGKVWVTFTCPVVVNGTDSCKIGTGYALFEDCDDGSEE